MKNSNHEGLHFYNWRIRYKLNYDTCGKIFGVTPRTIKNWEDRRSLPNYVHLAKKQVEENIKSERGFEETDFDDF